MNKTEFEIALKELADLNMFYKKQGLHDRIPLVRLQVDYLVSSFFKTKLSMFKQMADSSDESIVGPIEGDK